MFRNFMNLHFVCLLSNLRSINSSPTENSHTVENKEKPFSDISLNSNLSGVTARRRFINSTKKRINYDSIISGEFKKLGWNRKSLETELINQKDSLFLILDSIDKNLYHLPESEFYIECYENGLFSKLFTRESNNYLSNVIYFFIFSKILLEHFTLETIIKYLGKGQENNIIADKIFKVLECSKRILIFHSSLFSTLQIIKENDEIWESYYNDEEKILFYAFFLIKGMLSNIDLAFITNMNVDTEDLCDSGLNEFGIYVFEINVFGEKNKKNYMAFNLHFKSYFFNF